MALFDDRSSELPLKEIPGDLGLPVLGPISDRFHYNYLEGHYEFIKSRVEEYNSTVFRMNLLFAEFIDVPDPRVIVLADSVSFPILFDHSKVEKKDVLIGNYVPPTSFTGGYKVSGYLDPSDEKHGKLKSLYLDLFASIHHKVIQVSQTCFADFFDNLDSAVAAKGEASLNTYSDDMTLNLLLLVFFDIDPAKLRNKGPTMMRKWLALQFHSIASLGLPKWLSWLEDTLFHTFPWPSFLVKSDYQKIYDAIYVSSTPVFEEAKKLGLSKEETCHNLVFMSGANAYAGMSPLFRALIKWIHLAGENLHKDLADEIRSVVKSEGGVVTLASIEKMSLTKSVVFEVLRMEPPAENQYARAKEDMVISSHDASFQVKKGELLFGYQPLAARDPKIFENPNEFIGTRFMGEEGEKLLKYGYWFNERQIVDPTPDNKQCPGKYTVLLLARLMVVEFFLRYDTFTAEIGKFATLIGSTVTVKTLTKATTK
ncbi:hypothetical protein MKW94_009105 [Papaver nudicaule]|uniref:Uncharacterized protein n=1 Tax=Papaver nudicaule TaxID=74823 RepID=A0AA41SJA4_PAPNU|nr:hypothetical protein [Papaver nudicaule]